MLIAEPATQSNIWPTIGMFALLFGLMYLMFIRPQSKRRKEALEMQRTLGPGDEVITIGGLHGTVLSADDSIVEVEISDGVSARFERPAIARVVRPTDAPEAAAETATEEPVSPIQETKQTS